MSICRHVVGHGEPATAVSLDVFCSMETYVLALSATDSWWAPLGSGTSQASNVDPRSEGRRAAKQQTGNRMTPGVQ